MPPRSTKKDVRAIETRKVKAASKKKDPTKITDDEYEKLLTAFTEKLNRLQSIFKVDIPKRFKNLKCYNPTTELYRLCGVDFSLKCEFEIRRVDESLHIDFNCSYQPETDSFIFDLERPHNLVLGNNKFNPFQIFDTWISKIYSLFLDRHYDDAIDEYVVTKDNINSAISDIDTVLNMFFENSTIGSPTGSYNQEYFNFFGRLNSLCTNPRYNIIKDHKILSEFPDGGNMAGCNLVIRLGEYEMGNTYKIEIQFGQSISGGEFLSIIIHKWSDHNGWILLDKITSKVLVFGSIAKARDVPLKIENNHTYDHGHRYTKMLLFALEYIHKFSNFEPNYMYMDKEPLNHKN